MLLNDRRSASRVFSAFAERDTARRRERSLARRREFDGQLRAWPREFARVFDLGFWVETQVSVVGCWGSKKEPLLLALFEFVELIAEVAEQFLG